MRAGVAAGELVDGTGGQIEHAGGHKRSSDGLVVGGRTPAEPPLVGVSAATDEVGYLDAFGCYRGLGKQAEVGGEGLGRDGADVSAVEVNRTRVGRV